MVRLGAFVTPSAQDAEATVAEIVRAEELGLDLVGIQDHPYQRRFLDTFTLMTWAAARTSRITLFPDVANLPLRPPAMLAKQAASIDVLSGGRFELGLGAGAFWDGIAAMDGPRRTGPESVDALVEAIEVLRRWWRGDRGRWEGEHYALRGAAPGPPPAHDIGIWLGAYGPRMMRVVGTHADGWVPSLPRMPLEEVGPKRRAIDEAAERAGRDPSAVLGVANVNGTITDGPAEGWLQGPVEHWVEELAMLHREHRFSAFVFWGEGGPEQLERFAGEVAPALRAELA